ncbi:MAG: ankyrin repeat domain-containing protein [Gallionella sp.]
MATETNNNHESKHIFVDDPELDAKYSAKEAAFSGYDEQESEEAEVKPFEKTEVPEWLRDFFKDTDNALHVAMRNGDLDEAKRLIEEDGDLLDAVNHENKRPLQVADIGAVDKDGNTALHYAAAVGTKSDVMDLVQRGADLDAQNHLGNAPIDWAQQVENNNTLETLDDLVQRSRGISLS